MTVKLQLLVWPLASRALQETVVLPTGKLNPEAGLQLMTGDGSQRLVAVTLKLTVFAHWPGEA